MPITIYPAIDMRGGKCVRLLQGDYDKETVYGDSPFDMAKQFADDGAEWIHMVDLDGAREGKRVNDRHVLEVANNLSARVQVGGGIRTEEDVAYYLENGVDRIILGSSAISDPDFVKRMLAKYKEKIAIGIDARDGYVAVEGWLKTSEIKAVDLGKELAEHGAEVFIFTDISKDGMLSGPNVEAIAELGEATGKDVIASGGISNLDDVKSLEQRSDSISGAIIGKALYTNQFTLKQALEV
ncbi:1-(5-phosphoribosyl)-5-[(5-phosphoribosylamino)methylideneamino]imidazole-4-carboxamide isomerase [Pseudalkalibacillus hwajinpoensis]|uniref:1-(5-phosphoribosyl)-5-[(5- phosphoribosylamino)methylideneamino]imidazole-4- carboxamide isomerase n=1 Tax=Guptibacillus hwajinpoensis TaxID=208199 RepID=UPI001CD72234|nr:1-(5-phosphoribosyl)-5-[(5-phosphoribosylamino)methylideneamino]imidazole-4-carboxamide isomerase [Pseudalkalibacillus hwajinpoensis]MCA0991654.1 1-(5-phosphoribosyl)-5-[(5-phosphoribosylamino)methylideneamino]imidazole-4-carboxamide isomerase [Pseudalkalibacillus hwajinpoensis]